MVPVKRYISGIRKPFILKGRWRFALILFVAVIFLVFFRTFFFTQLELVSHRNDLQLMAGDHILVNRLSYGLRMPLPNRWGYRRWGECNLDTGDLVAYDYPDGSGRIGLDRVIGLPGDTLWSEEDSTAFTVIPVGSYGVGPVVLSEKSVVGRPVCVSYSIDWTQPLYRMFRPHRFFMKIK